MDTQLAAKLAEKGVKTRDDLADLAVDELSEMTGMDAERAKKLIMAARAHWFAEEPKPQARRPRNVAQTSVAQFASELKVPPSVLLEQLRAAGVEKKQCRRRALRAGQVAAARVPAQDRTARSSRRTRSR